MKAFSFQLELKQLTYANIITIAECERASPTEEQFSCIY